MRLPTHRREPVVFFGAPIGRGRTRQGEFAGLLWIDVFVLGGRPITLGTALIGARG